MVEDALARNGVMNNPEHSTPLLEVQGLTVEFEGSDGWIPAVRDVSFSIAPGETLALVGESGSGKTVSALAVMGLAGWSGGRMTSGRVCLDGREISALGVKDLRAVRGGEIGMIFQQATRSLNPAFTVGDQIAETIRRHRKASRREAWARAVELLELVQIPNASKRAREYPHMFSGGMAQRVLIASALAGQPRLLIADEPTTALDVTVQAHIIELMRDLQEQTGVSILFISHDLAVVAEIAHRAAVMYAGEIVECASVEDVFIRPQHPYTAGLLASIPRVDGTGYLTSIPGVIPAPGEWPAGCHFAPRCDHVVNAQCNSLVLLRNVGSERMVRCARAEDLELAGGVS